MKPSRKLTLLEKLQFACLATLSAASLIALVCYGIKALIEFWP